MAHCQVPCAELNGDVEIECGACTSQNFACRPTQPDFPPSSGRVQVGIEATGAAVEAGEVMEAATDDDEGADDDDELNGLDCTPFHRTLGEGARAVRICPILNGIWTSFLDFRRWGPYDKPLAPELSRELAHTMASLYDDAGMSTWIGEDFDERVLSSLEAHHLHRQKELGQQEEAADTRDGLAPLLRYSIIVEQGRDVVANLDRLAARLGSASIHWVQLGPPALDHLLAYRVPRLSKKVLHYGVEDYSLDMLEAASKAYPLSTVQQEINAIVRPSAETRAFCARHGCKFVAYGPLLGGLLSDRYLGRARPVPDADHSKQIDYLDSIDAWASWADFQSLLRALREVGDAHTATGKTAVPIATVALAYVLQMENVLATIVGVRLDANQSTSADSAGRPRRRARSHRRDALAALGMNLTPAEVARLDAAVARGRILDGLART